MMSGTCVTTDCSVNKIFHRHNFSVGRRSKATVPIGEPLRHTKFGLKGADEKNEGMELIVG